MDNMLNLTKALSDARHKASLKFNEWIQKQDDEVKAAFDELLVSINELKVKIAALGNKA